MIHRKSILVAVAAATLAALVADGARAASPYQKSCEAAVTELGEHKQKTLARKIAKQRWAQTVAAIHGTAYATLQHASVQVDNCSIANPGWLCTFKARPCVYKRTDLSPHAPGTRVLRHAPLGLIN